MRYPLRFSLVLIILLCQPILSQYALHFDGDNDYVSANPGPTGMTSFTIEAWVQPEISDVHRVIVSNLGNYSAAGGYQLATNGGPSTFGLVFRDQSYTDRGIVGTTVIEPGQWYHVAGTYHWDGDDSQVELYVNGQLEAEHVFPGLQISYNNLSPLYIGSNMDGDPPGGTLLVREFMGTIDELRIWDHVRSSLEINLGLLFPATGDEEGLLALWRGDTGTGQVLPDITGNHDGTLGNSPNPDGSDPTWVPSMWHAVAIGCGDPEACNYDPSAVIWDITLCLYNDCLGECGGDAILDYCGVCLGSNDCPGNGDVDHDGQVTITDIVLMVEFVLGLTTPGDYQFWAADAHYNGSLNVVDIVTVVSFILGPGGGGN